MSSIDSVGEVIFARNPFKDSMITVTESHPATFSPSMRLRHASRMHLVAVDSTDGTKPQGGDAELTQVQQRA